MKSSDAALSCRRGTDPLQLSQVSVYNPGGMGTTSNPASASHPTLMNTLGQVPCLRCQMVATEAGQGERPICCCTAVSALMAI